MPSPYQRFLAHVEYWRDCEACDLCHTRRKIVLAKGKIPCDVLFIGEAPGESEDILGYPFAGPAGHLLDDIVYRAYLMAGMEEEPFRHAYTNLTGCIPRADTGKKAGEPSKASIVACSPRLAEIIEISQAKAVVLVGKLSKKHAQPLLSDQKVVGIVHPSFILHADPGNRALAFQTAVVTLSDFFLELKEAL